MTLSREGGEGVVSQLGSLTPYGGGVKLSLLTSVNTYEGHTEGLHIEMDQPIKCTVRVSTSNTFALQ